MNHSDTFLNRINDSKGKSKPLDEHKTHFIQRLRERFGIELSENEYDDLLKNVGRLKPIYKINYSNSIISAMIGGKEVWVMYGCKSGDLGSRFKTALHPNSYTVPDCLYKIFDHKTFGIEVEKFKDMAIKLAEEINLEDKKSFFLRTDIPDLNKSAALEYKEHGQSLEFIKRAVRSVVKYYSKTI